MKTRRRRRMHHNHLRKLIMWMGLITTPFLVLFLWDEAEDLIENFQSKKKMTGLTATQEALYVEETNRSVYNILLRNEQKEGESSRRVYPYSVVDGGVHSVEDLRLAIWRDPIVAQHYSNFKLNKARVVEAEADGRFHVSYRIGDEIFWTKKRLKVAKGEKLITDGTNFTRTRCANVLSEVPQGKTSADEPTPEVLDTPALPLSQPTPSLLPVAIGGESPGPGGATPEVLNTPTPLLSGPTPSIPPVVVGEGSPAPGLPHSGPMPFIPPIVIGGDSPAPGLPPSGATPSIPPAVIGGDSPAPAPPLSGPTPFAPPVDIGGGPPDPPAPVPEPTTMLLLGSGLLGLWGFRKKFRK